jgi:hypothetical protein
MANLEAPVVEEVAPVEEVQASVEPVIEIQPGEAVSIVETDSQAAAQSETAVTSEEPEEEVSFDQLFALKSETLTEIEPAVEEDEELGDVSKKTGKKKKPKHVEVTYDPDRDLTTAVKKHKRGGGWEWEE